MLFNNVIEKYRVQVLTQKRASTQATTAHHLEFWRYHLGDLEVSAITPMDIRRVRDTALAEMKRSDGKFIKGDTCNRYMATLAHIFTMACREWELIGVNPCQNVSRSKPSPPRSRILSTEETKRLLDACYLSRNARLYTAVVLAIETGMRRSEIQYLRYDTELKLADTLDKSYIYLPPERVKTNQEAMIPLSQRSWELLRQLPRLCDRVFPIQFRSAFIEARKRARLDGFRFHDLRHVHATRLGESGASLVEIQRSLRHKTPLTSNIYINLTADHTRQVVAKAFGEAVI